MPLTAEPFDARLVSARPLTPGVRELVFERADDRPLTYEAGQWVNLLLPLAGGEVKRAYSIASAPVAGSNRFEIAVTRVSGGAGSIYLHDVAEGTKLRAIGPHGLFTRGGAERSPALFVATGTGVTPLRAMMQDALRAKLDAPVWLLFGARHEEDVLYRQEVEQWARELPNVRYDITLSRPAPGWSGRTGYVQTHVPELWAELSRATAEAAHVYICGLERMVGAVREVCRKDLGIGRKQVHTERYD